MKALAIAALLLVGVTACDDSDAVSTNDASTTSTASSVTSTSDTSDTTDDTSASSTSVVAMSTSTSMLTETTATSTSTTGGSTTSTKSAPTAKPGTTASSAASGASGLVLSDKGVGVANFGASRAQAESAITKLVGPVDDVDTSATCWGEMVVLSWDNGLSVQFLRDELYNWSLTSDELGGPKGVSVGDPARDLVAAFDDYKASSAMNELSGSAGMTLTNAKNEVWFRADLSALPDEDPDATLTNIDGEWGSAEKRLFTVVDEDPNLFCGD